MTKKELQILEIILNEELLSYLSSFHKLDDKYVKDLRNIIKKLGLREVFNFNKIFKGE